MIAYRMIRQGRYREGWGERLGFVPRRAGAARCFWIHAVSMGEVNAASTIIGALQREFPDCDLVVSSTTDTGISRARKLYGDKATVVFYPFDFSFAVKRALTRLRPDICILMELEAWPNFTHIARKLNIPVVVANGRISSGKGFPRYKKVAWLIRPMFARLSAVMVQDQEYAGRFEYLGVAPAKIFNVGSLKYDTAEVTDNVSGSEALAGELKIDPEVPLLVAGSTGTGEEEVILDCYRQIIQDRPELKLRLAIIPRKPEKFVDVASQIEKAGLSLIRYSQVKSGKVTVTESHAESVILGDTMGDLRKFYSLASIIFVGRSLVPMGGSDMMEAAALGKPVIVGPYTENFSQTINALRAGNGIVVVTDAKALKQVIVKLSDDKEYAKGIAVNGRKVIIDHKGATDKTIEQIRKIVVR
ncbi:MAG: 3-deoxy-D-manno-octulosonic acid transferase [Sedimentisphaerales bacterium]|nr:3-deoxy-D-manno-octulosonic acid transferase [Sedimentisphaerales bacterium]MBN2843052.1 3-deoxy-D-manno-octulosonic acid transferase [Sedimentisphaerales bacterium]